MDSKVAEMIFSIPHHALPHETRVGYAHEDEQLHEHRWAEIQQKADRG